MPRLVGDAGWPWVRASIGTGFQARAFCSRSAATTRSSGSSTSRHAAFIASGSAVLLMSWEVRPKWMYSLNGLNPSASNSSLRMYSTALTSWLVTRSTSLTRWATCWVKLR
ncbi:MAG: hypothetical protein MUD16_15920 [Desulfobacterales bacterium]|nr:hypothetical protein [Desulfobacterales bacterium]